MDKAVQAAAGAEPVGGTAELQAGGAVREAGGWVHGGGDGEDVWGAGKFVAREVGGLGRAVGLADDCGGPAAVDSLYEGLVLLSWTGRAEALQTRVRRCTSAKVQAFRI